MKALIIRKIYPAPTIYRKPVSHFFKCLFCKYKYCEQIKISKLK